MKAYERTFDFSDIDTYIEKVHASLKPIEAFLPYESLEMLASVQDNLINAASSLLASCDERATIAVNGYKALAKNRSKFTTISGNYVAVE